MNITISRFSLNTLACFGALSLIIVGPAVSQAATVFTNLGAGNTSSLDGNDVGDDLIGDNLAEADTFTPSANYTLTSIELALSCWGTCPNDFSVELTSNLGGLPNTSTGVIEDFTVAGTSLAAPSTTSLVTLTSTPIALTAGTPYWIVVLPDTGGADRIQWNWNTTSDISNEATAFAGGGPADTFYTLGQTPSAYQVNGTPSTVPEPGTLGILLSGGLMIALLRNSRSSSRLNPQAAQNRP